MQTIPVSDGVQANGDAGAAADARVHDYEEYVNALRSHIKTGQSDDSRQQASKHKRTNSVVFDEIVPTMKSTFLQTSTQAQLRQFPICVQQNTAKAR